MVIIFYEDRRPFAVRARAGDVRYKKWERVMARWFWAMVFGLVILVGGIFVAEPVESEPKVVGGGYGQQKVVYHFNERNWKVIRRGLRHIQNHLRVVGKDNLKIVVVAHAGGLVMLLRHYVPRDIERTVAALQKQGVDFRACAGTLRAQRIKKPKDKLIRCRIVPCGVCELVKLQQQGYAYIKP